MKTAILILLVAILVLAGACRSTINGEETQSAVPDSTIGAEIEVEPAPGSYLSNSHNESSGVILKDVQIKTDICDKEYFSPWYPSHTVKRGDPWLVVSGHIQNRHEENSEIAMYAEGYKEAGERRSCNSGRRCEYKQFIVAETITRASGSLLMPPDYAKVFGLKSVPFR